MLINVTGVMRAPGAIGSTIVGLAEKYSLTAFTIVLGQCTL